MAGSLRRVAGGVAGSALARPARADGPEALKAFIADLRMVSHCPAISVAVVHGGEEVWRYATCWANVAKEVRVSTDHAFNIASVSKTVTRSPCSRRWRTS